MNIRMLTSRLVAASVAIAPLCAGGPASMSLERPSQTPASQHQMHHPTPATGDAQERPAMGRHFENAEQWAREFDDPARDAWQQPDRVIAALGLKPGMKVADIGAGTGYFSSRLARHATAPTVYAVDIEPSMVKYLSARATKEGVKNLLAVQAGESSPNLPEPVDVVLIVDTYHHIPNRVAYFTALRKSLRPGGVLAIVDFRKDSPSGPPTDFRFTPEDVARELMPADYSGTSVITDLPRQWMALFTPSPRM